MLLVAAIYTSSSSYKQTGEAIENYVKVNVAVITNNIGCRRFEYFTLQEFTSTKQHDKMVDVTLFSC